MLWNVQRGQEQRRENGNQNLAGGHVPIKPSNSDISAAGLSSVMMDAARTALTLSATSRIISPMIGPTC